MIKLVLIVLISYCFALKIASASPTQSPDEQLIESAQNGDLAGVKAALAAGAKINTPKGPTALLTLDDPGRNPEKSESIARELLKSGADINAPGPDGKSFFQQAICGGSSFSFILTVIEDYKPDVHFVDEHHNGVVALAMQQGWPTDETLVEVKHPSQPSTFYYDNLLAARKLILLDAPVDAPNSDGITPLMTVAENGRADDTLDRHLDFARLLLAKGADPTRKDKHGKTAAEHALEQNNYAMLLLLDTGQKHQEQYTKVRKRDLEQRLSWAVGRAMEPPQKPESGEPLVDQVDAMAIITETLKESADPNALSSNGQTTIFGQTLGDPSYPSTTQIKLALVQFLLDHGADPNLRLPSGKIPLELVFNQPEFYALLKARGAKPDRQLQLTLSSSPTENDDIREAIFRHQIGPEVPGKQQRVQVYFLSVLDHASGKYIDPSPDFMKRFAKNKPRVAKESECTSSPYKGVRDKVTGEEGLIFQVGFIKWIAEDEVEVEGGYYEAGLSASGNTYHLRKKNGKWVVVKDVMNWIS
jgi:ankyrin repeat protein